MTGGLSSDNVTEITAAILIGGRARRLNGRFKPCLHVGERPIVTRQLDAIARSGVEYSALIGRWPVDNRPPRPVFADAIEDGGALGALYTALLIATTDETLVVAGDMPLVAPALLTALMSLGPEDDALIPRSDDGLHPLCGCYRRSVARRLKARLDRGVLSIHDALGDLHVRELGPAELAEIDPDSTMLMNVNTLADYERACAIARNRN